MEDILQKLIEYLPVVLTFIIGFIWTRVSKILTALKETSDVLTTLTVSLGDKELTKEEIKDIQKELLEAIASWKAVFKK